MCRTLFIDIPNASGTLFIYNVRESFYSLVRKLSAIRKELLRNFKNVCRVLYLCRPVFLSLILHLSRRKQAIFISSRISTVNTMQLQTHASINHILFVVCVCLVVRESYILAFIEWPGSGMSRGENRL